MTTISHLSAIIIVIMWCCSSGWTQTPIPECTSHSGDINQDGFVSSGDAQLAFDIALGTSIPTRDEWCAADCNGDGVISTGDAQSIFYKSLGMGDCVEVLTPTPTATPTTGPGAVSVGNRITVSGGVFTQGSPATESCRFSTETQFNHELIRNIEVMETEITRQMWADLRAVQPGLPEDPSYVPYSPTLSHPVQQNTWHEAILFANLLSLQNGYTPCYYADAAFTALIDGTSYMTGPFYCQFDADGFRLPTEGEWEYFTRAGTSGPFSCTEPQYGPSTCSSSLPNMLPTLEQYCVFCANHTDTSAAAGSKLPNPWHLKDVHGNVWEWCWDWYTTYPTGTVTDYTGPAVGTDRVIRGGGWFNVAHYCRSASRYNYPPGLRADNLGFRLVRTIP